MSTASSGNRSRVLKCRHFCNPWDLHNYCPTCRESSKGDNYCVTGKGKCMECVSFIEEQKEKIINRKRYVKKDINPHPNPAMSYWEIPEPEYWD